MVSKIGEMMKIYTTTKQLNIDRRRLSSMTEQSSVMMKYLDVGSPAELTAEYWLEVEGKQVQGGKVVRKE